jgi:rare lipoprotein A
MRLVLLLIISVVNSFASETGYASWYGKENSISCTGKRLRPGQPALAHRTLPIGTKVKITSLKTQKSIVAVVEDRGPYIKGRIVDLNITAAKYLNIIESGICKVKVEQIQ